MASTLRSPQRTSAAAIAMARPSQLEHRLLAILDSSRSRRGLTRAAMCAVLVVGVTTLAVLAVCRADIKMASEPAASQPASQPAADAGSVRDVRSQDGAQRSLEKQAEATTARPVVIKTFPVAQATNVDPATNEIRVTFSKDMADGSWSWVTLKSNAFPKISGKIRYLEDKRTCVLPVQLEPNHHYKLGINSNRFRNFQDPDGRSAEPFVLEFDTGPGDSKAPATAPAEDRPKIVKTIPEANAKNVDPNLTAIRVTFSKEMIDGNWSWVTIGPEVFPTTTGKPRYLEDKRTCELPVKLEPNHHYRIGLNTPPYIGFRDTSRQAAEGMILEFDTGPGDGK